MLKPNTSKNFSYNAYMHLGNYDRPSTLSTSSFPGTETTTAKRREELVAAVVKFRLHVHHSVELQSFSTLASCQECHLGLCTCSCHKGNQNVGQHQNDNVSNYDYTDVLSETSIISGICHMR